MRLVVAAMHRSGINAISKWLLRQSSLKSKSLNPVWEDWVEDYNDMGHISHMFISQINHPDHSDWRKMNNGVENVVMTIERESTKQVEEFSREHKLYNYRPIHDYIDIDYDDTPTWTHVFIVRSFKNWLASIVKAHENALANDPNNPIIRMYNVHEDIARYRTYLDRLGVHDSWEQSGFEPHTIFYDSWVKDADYRKDICRDLGLRYTNCGYREVPQNCGGSSFDGLEFDGQAQNMKVLERWKEFEDNEEFMKTLDRYSEVCELSDRFIGE